jgi:hypothetical protein
VRMVEVDEVGRDPASRVGVGAASDDVGWVDGGQGTEVGLQRLDFGD